MDEDEDDPNFQLALRGLKGLNGVVTPLAFPNPALASKISSGKLSSAWPRMKHSPLCSTATL